ncbi:hypothetical protein CY35_07G108300 [Sphagnum magellanicum]|uniref:Uncharacterized protein n=2 Tax=Sphagnum magellanicum TaxID=128215 RepID=A0ACB8HNY4_9BRYO|nr:hypothetical protein CY35_07G108300 [Sphagnum magellanicum]KAH9557891.1 hypothetical protein CY35_07G108300 [Sphagnum magellanicum]
MAQRMASSMITGRSKSVPIHGSSFHGDSLLSSSPRSCGLASNPRIRPGQGVIAMMPFTEGGAVKDHYATLGVSPGSSKHEIKMAYRRLALQYHPDVCDGEHCSLNFQQINKAYESLLSKRTLQFGEFEDDLSDNLEGFMGVGDDCWEDWEEWMGWEGAGIRDFSSHVNVHT